MYPQRTVTVVQALACFLALLFLPMEQLAWWARSFWLASQRFLQKNGALASIHLQTRKTADNADVRHAPREPSSIPKENVLRRNVALSYGSCTRPKLPIVRGQLTKGYFHIKSQYPTTCFTT